MYDMNMTHDSSQPGYSIAVYCNSSVLDFQTQLQNLWNILFAPSEIPHLLPVLYRLFLLCHLKLFLISWSFRMGQCTLWIWTDYFLFTNYSFKNCMRRYTLVFYLMKNVFFPFFLSSYIENIFRKFFCRYHMKLIHDTCILRFICLFLFFFCLFLYNYLSPSCNLLETSEVSKLSY